MVTGHYTASGHFLGTSGNTKSPAPTSTGLLPLHSGQVLALPVPVFLACSGLVPLLHLPQQDR